MVNYKHNTIALVYDFDGTLTPQPMQEYTVLPEIGIKGKSFWTKVKKESERTKGEEILTYMRLMIEMSHREKFPVTPKSLKKLAKNIKFYPGVETYFKRISDYIHKKYNGNIKVRHYIISAGLREIIEGTIIAKNFHKIFASEYYFDEYQHAVFPNVIVNDTLKTQFLFRINKGVEDLNQSINKHTPYINRAIPFQNILYLGDGLTDVPCMTVTRQQGGYAIAVYKTRSQRGKKICKELLLAQRADFIAQADFRKNSELEKLIKLAVHNMAAGIEYGKESFSQWNKYRGKENNVNKKRKK